MSDKLREVIERLKQRNSSSSQPEAEKEEAKQLKPAEPEETELEEEQESPEEQPIVEAPKADLKQVVALKPVQIQKQAVQENKHPTPEEIQQFIGKRVMELQNDGIYRFELLSQLAELNKSVTLLTAIIMKATGLEEEK